MPVYLVLISYIYPALSCATLSFAHMVCVKFHSPVLIILICGNCLLGTGKFMKLLVLMVVFVRTIL